MNGGEKKKFSGPGEYGWKEFHADAAPQAKKKKDERSGAHGRDLMGESEVLDYCA